MESTGLKTGKASAVKRAPSQKPLVEPKAPGPVLSGICAACKNGPHCTLIKPGSPAPIHCGQFEEYPPYHNFTPEQLTTPAPAETKKSLSVMGLCAHCAAYDSCTFPKPQGGVWACDEYVEI